MRTGFVIFGMLAALFSCLDEPDCIKTADTALIIQFKKLIDGKNDTLIFYRVEAEGSDSIFYGQNPDVLDTLEGQPLVVAIDPFSDFTSFTFFLPLLDRRLKVGYSRSTRFISEDCGSESFFLQLTVLESEFDSVKIVSPVLSEERTTNIEIYR